MVKIRIEYDKNGCIGAAACVPHAPQAFVLDSEGKADLVGHREEAGRQVLELEVPDAEPFLNAARACPVLIITVLDAAGKQLAP